MYMLKIEERMMSVICRKEQEKNIELMNELKTETQIVFSTP